MSSKFKNNLSDLSAIGTEFEITDYDNLKAIRKITNLNEKFHDYDNEIINQISLFMSNLELAGNVLAAATAMSSMVLLLFTTVVEVV